MPVLVYPEGSKCLVLKDAYLNRASVSCQRSLRWVLVISTEMSTVAENFKDVYGKTVNLAKIESRLLKTIIQLKA